MDYNHQIHRKVHNIIAKKDDRLCEEQTENNNDDSNRDLNQETNEGKDEKPIELQTMRYGFIMKVYKKGLIHNIIMSYVMQSNGTDITIFRGIL